MELRFDDPTPRRFVLVRDKDISGISGTGKVASGCVFPDGSAVLHWNTKVFSTTVFQDIKELEKLHGHDGATRIEFVEDPKGFQPKTAQEGLIYSNTSQGDRVFTWKELYEQTKIEMNRYQHLVSILSDLDRCEHGRHEADNCFGCGGQSHGNQHLKDRVIGNNIRGNTYVVPEHTYAEYEDWLVKREAND